MHREIGDRISITQFRPTDKLACVEYFKDREIYRRTLRIPPLYTHDDFERPGTSERNSGRGGLRRE